MRYYLIVGEASGDLHASHLMKALMKEDPEAEFRFFGGDNMSAVGGTRVRHYKELAYMGFIPVLLHLPTILRNMSMCKRDIMEWQPDVVIPVDYAGFNLSICKFLQDYRLKHPSARVARTFYYISPKIWAWKEYRIKNFKRDVNEMFCILPFEVDFFEKKHQYPVHYVGNPTADEVRLFKSGYAQSYEAFCKEQQLDATKQTIALLPGSRMQEIKDNLNMMLRVAKAIEAEQQGRYQYVIAAAPAIQRAVYEAIISQREYADVKIHITQPAAGSRVGGATYPLLSHATAALVTSGTATLETALFRVPQVVCYKTPLPRLFRWGFNNIIKCKYISLVNLIADSEVVPELFADRFTFDEVLHHFKSILPGGSDRDKMLRDYDVVHNRLGNMSAPENAAKKMLSLLRE